MPQHFLRAAQNPNGSPGGLKQPKNEASVPTPTTRLISGEEKGHNFEFCAKVADSDPC